MKGLNSMCVIPSKKSLDRLGKALLQLGENEEADDVAYKQLNHYRSLFHPLMNIVNQQCRIKIAKTLPKTKAKKAMVVQRIKRLESIILKLERFTTMQLSNMQDIGGVRVILPDIQSVETFTKNLFSRSKKIVVKNKKNYIVDPKPEDGYRGIHYQLELANTRLEVAPFEKLMVELQVRTLLQHCWATGVEIAGIINNKQYKTGDWDTDWHEFFKVLGDCFAIAETANSSYTNVPLQIRKNLLLLINKLDIFQHLHTASAIVQLVPFISSTTSLPSNAFLLLIADFDLGEMRTTVYKDEEKALEHLTIWEKRFNRLKAGGGLKGQVLLIKTEDIKKLKDSYPNYYMNSKLLIEQLTLIVEETKQLVSKEK